MTRNSGSHNHRSRTAFQRFVWIGIIILSAVVLFPELDRNALVDFRSAWSAARLLCQGENPYDERALLPLEKSAGWTQPDAVVPWNPPWALSIITPFALLPFAAAKWIWLLGNGLLLIFVADYWWREYGGSTNHRMISWLASLWFFPCIVALYFGQMSLLVLSGLSGIVWCVKRDKPLYLGFFILLASLKPHLLMPVWLILLLWLFRQKRWRTVVWCGYGVTIAAIAVVCLRPEIYIDYLLGAVSKHGPVVWATPTLGTAMRVAFPAIQKWIVFIPGFLGLLLSAILWTRWRDSFSWERDLDVILLISLTTASYAWIFDWAILLPVVIRILVWLNSNARSQWPSIMGLIFVMGMFVWVQAKGWFPLGAIWFPWGLALVYGWSRWRQKQIVGAATSQALW